MLSHVAVEDHVVLQNQVAKADITLLRPSLMYQEHGCQVTHTLDIANIRPIVLKGTQDIYQTLAQRVHLLKQLVQVRKGSRDVFDQEGVLLDGTIVHYPLARKRLILVPFRRLLHGKGLLYLIGGASKSVITLEFFKDLRVYSEIISDEGTPELAPEGHWDGTSHDLRLELGVPQVLFRLI
jgi:hypothetical protein